MPLKEYGVLKGRPVNIQFATRSNTHYQIHVVDNETDYRVAVNVKSQLSPSELEYLIDDRFSHPLTAALKPLDLGFHALESRRGGLALDFIRGNLLDPAQMRPLPFDVPGPANDLNEIIDAYVQQAMGDEDALVYVFGERWGPEAHKKDKIFGFLPGNGVHDVHMNQGNDDRYEQDDGVWQDGGMLLHFPDTDQWVAVFLKFQSQSWHTDDATGHRIESAVALRPDVDGVIRVVAAMVNPVGGAPETERVTLLNTSPQEIDLKGWALANREKQRAPLSGALGAGKTVVIELPDTMPLGNKGGIITLLNAEGLKVNGVAYTEGQAAREGWTIKF